MRRHFLHFGFSCLLVLVGPAVCRAAMFEPLFTVERIVGSAVIEKPNGERVPLREDFSYPYGSRVSVLAPSAEAEAAAVKAGTPLPRPEVMVSLSPDHRFRFSEGTTVRILDATTVEEGVRKEVKVIDVEEGLVNTFITSASTKTGNEISDLQVEANLAAIIVRTPLADATRLSDRNKIRVSKDPSIAGGSRVLFVSQSGNMEVIGPQFHVKKMKLGSAVKLEGTRDYTYLATAAGEFTVQFEKGSDAQELALFRTDWFAKIRRQYAEIGRRMAVSVMVVSGRRLVSSFSYLEGQTGVGQGSSAAAEVAGEHTLFAAPVAPAVDVSAAAADPFSSFDEAPAADAPAAAPSKSTEGSSTEDDFSFDDWDF